MTGMDVCVGVPERLCGRLVVMLVEAGLWRYVKMMGCVDLWPVYCSKKSDGDDGFKVNPSVLIYSRLTCQLPRGPRTDTGISQHDSKSNILFTARFISTLTSQLLRERLAAIDMRANSSNVVTHLDRDGCMQEHPWFKVFDLSNPFCVPALWIRTCYTAFKITNLRNVTGRWWIPCDVFLSALSSGF